MPLGVEVGLGPGHIVLDGDPAKGAQPPVFGPCLLWPNGWMDEDAPLGTEVDLDPDHIVRWGPSSPRERGTADHLFSAHVYCGQMLDE